MLAGWYVLRAGGLIACGHTNGKGWWTIGGRKMRLPEGWTLGPSIDELLNAREGFSLTRRDATPGEITERKEISLTT